MKKIISTTLVILLLTFFKTMAQSCIRVDSVWSTAKAKDLNRRDIKFGIKQISEDELSNNWCLSQSGESVKIELFYFGIPKTSLRILGVEKTTNKTQVGVRIYFRGKVYDGIGESEIEVKAMLIELVDTSVMFSGTTLSSAIKKALIECIGKLPR